MSQKDPNMFYKYLNCKNTTQENVGLMLNGSEKLVTKDTEKAKILNVLFPQYLPVKLPYRCLGPLKSEKICS